MPADWGQRFAARLIDVIIAQVVAVGVLIPAMIVIFPLVGPGRGEMMMFLILALFFLVYWGYEIVCSRRFEATPGKRMMNLRVMRAGSGGAPEEPPESAIVIRGAVWAAPLLFSWSVPVNLLSGVFWLVNVLWPLWDQPNRQALHDKAAGTVVVRLR